MGRFVFAAILQWTASLALIFNNAVMLPNAWPRICWPLSSWACSMQGEATQEISHNVQQAAAGTSNNTSRSCGSSDAVECRHASQTRSRVREMPEGDNSHRSNLKPYSITSSARASSVSVRDQRTSFCKFPGEFSNVRRALATASHSAADHHIKPASLSSNSPTMPFPCRS